MPHLPRNFARCHHLTQPWQRISQKTRNKSAAPTTKNTTHLLKTRQKFCACRGCHTTTFDTFSDTRECQEVSRLPRKTTLQPALAPSKRIVLQLPSIDTARPQENQRLATRHAGASKWTFRARPPPIFTLCSFKIDVFLWVFLTNLKICISKTMFRAKLPPIFILSHKNSTPTTEVARCHYFTQPWQCDSQNTQRDTSKVLHLPRKMTMEVSKVLRLPRKLQLIVPNNAKVLRVPTTKRLLARHETCWNVTKCHPCHAKQSYATLGVNATSSELSEHTLNMPQPPDPQSEMATWLRIRENNLILPPTVDLRIRGPQPCESVGASAVKQVASGSKSYSVGYRKMITSNSSWVTCYCRA